MCDQDQGGDLSVTPTVILSPLYQHISYYIKAPAVRHRVDDSVWFIIIMSVTVIKLCLIGPSGLDLLSA